MPADIVRLNPASAEPLRAAVVLAREVPFALGGLTVEPATRQVTYRDRSNETLEPRVMEVLVALHRGAGAILTRDDLIAACWRGTVVGEDAIQRVIQRLRKVAERADGSFRIETITKVGYRLLADEQTKSGDAAPCELPRAAIAVGVVTLLAVLAALAWWHTSRPQVAHHYTVAMMPSTAATPELVREARALDDAVTKRLTSATEVELRSGRGDFALQATVAKGKEGYKIEWTLRDVASGTLLAVVGVDRSVPQAADAIAMHMSCAVGGSEEFPGKLAPEDLKLYAQQCAAVHIATAGGFARARDLGRELTRRQPGFSRAWSGLAAANFMLSNDPAQAAARVAEAQTTAREAVRIDPTNPEAHSTLALLKPMRDWAGRAEEFRRSVDTRVSACGCEHGLYAGFLMQTGQARAAAAEYRRQIDMTPYGSEGPIGLARMAEFLGDHAAADAALKPLADRPKVGVLALIDWHRALVRRDWHAAGTIFSKLIPPQNQPPFAALFAALQAGEPTKIAAARAALASEPFPDGARQELRVWTLAASGDLAGALEAIDRMLIPPAGPEGPINSAAAHGLWLMYDPLLAPARGDPHYVALLQRAGLLDYWKASRTKPDLCSEASAPDFCGTL